MIALLSFVCMIPGSITVTDQPICPGKISPMQNGQFIEYLCNLVPGMWAEKLCDEDFVGLSPYKFAFVREKDDQEHPWYPSGEVQAASYATDTSVSLNGVSSQRIEVPSTAIGGLSQDGISLRATQLCVFRVWAREEGLSHPVEVSLHDSSGDLGSGSFTPSGDWEQYQVDVRPRADSDHATLSIEYEGPGKLWLACASLTPNNTDGGWRMDVVEALRKITPSVIRIGGSVMDDPNLGDFHWEDTVGPIEKRKPFRAWGGLQPIGAGLEEVVQLIRSADAEPLICIRFRSNTPQGAADEVQYFNGSTDTPMGALRAANGHPKPYGIKYWQIGNEQASPEYEAALPEFCKAIKAIDPSAQILSSFPTEGVLKGAGDWLSFTCPHQYDCEDLQAESDELGQVRQLISANAPGKNIKIGITEWNTTAGDMGLKRAGLWDLHNALACARYMNLLHRNADIVEIADRSNLTNSFCSGIIQTNSHQIYFAPTYYAHWLYAKAGNGEPLKIDPPAPLGEGLDVSAVRLPNGELALYVVNQSNAPLEQSFELPREWAGNRNCQIWTLADSKEAGDPNVTNSFQDAKRVAISSSSAHSEGGKYKGHFPRLSVSLVVIN